MLERSYLTIDKDGFKLTKKVTEYFTFRKIKRFSVTLDYLLIIFWPFSTHRSV